MTTPVNTADAALDLARKAYEKATEDYAAAAFKAFAEAALEDYPNATHLIVEFEEINSLADWTVEVDGEELSTWGTGMAQGEAEKLEALEEYLRDNTPDFLETRPHSIVAAYAEDTFEVDRSTSLLSKARLSIPRMLGVKPADAQWIPL